MFVSSRASSEREDGRRRLWWETPRRRVQIFRVRLYPLTIHIIPTIWEEHLYEISTVEHSHHNTTLKKCVKKKEKMWVGMRVYEELMGIYRGHSLTRPLINMLLKLILMCFEPRLTLQIASLNSLGLVQTLLSEILWKCIQII